MAENLDTWLGSGAPTRVDTSGIPAQMLHRLKIVADMLVRSCRPDGPALVWLDDKNVVRVQSLTKTEIVGRDHSSSIVIKDAKLSRNHFRLSPTAAGWIVEDAESRNGTYANGERLTAPRDLLDGDLIQAGNTLFVFFADLQA